MKANQEISFEELLERTFGDNVLFLTASSTSGLSISYTSSNPGVATIVGNAVLINRAGECTITASQAGNNNYRPSQPVDRTLIVHKAPQYINFNTLSVKTFGDAPFNLQASASSGDGIQFASNNPSLVSITGNQVTIHGAGVVEITASQSGNINYLAAEDVVQLLTVQKAPQTIVFNAIPAKTYGDLPFSLVATSNSGLPVTFESQYVNLLTIQGNTATIVGAGTLKIYAMQNGNENYLPKKVEQTLIINKASQTITFEPLPTKKFGDRPFAISATSSSGLPVLFGSNRKTVARVSNATVTIVGAGTAPIVASQPGNMNYLAAPNVIQPLVVTALGNSYPLMGISRSGGNGRGTIFNVNTNGSDFITQKNFNSNAFNAPQSGLIKGSDGKLYGTIMSGGSPSNGVVFSIKSDGTQYTVLHNFDYTNGQRPFGNVMEASNGFLYGMTYDGGTNNSGVLFKIKKDGTEFLRLYEFPGATSNGYHPLGGLIEGTNGDLYGMTNEGGASAYGVLFSIKKDGTGFTKLIDFSTAIGAMPRGDLIQGPDGYLYGLTLRGGSANLGVLFKVKTDGTDYIKLIEFDGALKGSNPGASLIIANDGKLYGMTQSGGSNDKGTIFSVNTNGTAFTKLFEFDGSNSGSLSLATLVQSPTDGYLYGTSNQGGASDLGVVFKIKTNGTDFTKLLNFNSSNGANPVFGPLLEVEPGKFYGMTSKGGSSNAGIIFSVTSAGSFTNVKEFPQPEGTPEVISSGDGNQFFGVASSGGVTGNGAIFKTAVDGSQYEKIHDLEGNVLVAGRLIHTSDNSIWGSGSEGVFTITGILFRLDADGTNFQRVEFDNAPGLTIVHLIEGPNQFLYGTGYMAGSPHGIIFRFRTNGTDFTKLADIPGGSLGSRPTENLVITDDGNLFGLTHEGGANNWGAVFKFNISTLQYSCIFSLQSSTTGSYPKKIALLNSGSLCIANAVGGAENSGSIFTISPDGNDYDKIFDFGSSSGIGPTDIIQTVDGYLVGATQYGGVSNSGIIYEMLADGSNFRKIFEFTGENGSNPKSLHFRKEVQTITCENPTGKQYNDQPFALTGTNSAGLPIVFTSSNESIASIDGNMVTIHGVGQVTITASTAGSANFFQAQSVERTLIITKDDQTTTFDPLEDQVIGSPALNLSGTTTSGLPLEFSTSSDKVSVTGNTLTLLSPGMVTINANQSGNALYNAAPQLSQTLCIIPTKPVITSTMGTAELLSLSSNYSTGNQWYKNGDVISGETSNTLQVTTNGSYTVAVKIDGCVSAPSDAHVAIITGLEDEQTQLHVYPNPVQEKLILDAGVFSNRSVEIQIMDSSGGVVKRITTNNSLTEINVADLPVGHYILSASNGSSKVALHFVKN